MSSAPILAAERPAPALVGPLAGLTVLRFAHAFSSGGGMERILADLDDALLARNAMTIIRLYIAKSPDEPERIERRGCGRLVLVPLPLAAGDTGRLASDHEATGRTLKQRARDGVLYHPAVWRLVGKRYALRRPLRHRPGEVVGAGARFEELCARFRIDLCLLHFFGGSDAEEILVAARQRGIPVVLHNHYANERFDHLAIRKHALLADYAAGVNGLDVPRYLRHRFYNLADGIDLTCFDPRGARRPALAPPRPILFLAARIVRPKGQLDLVRVAARLRDDGIKVCVALAGRVDSAAFEAELRAEIERLGLTPDVLFLGELTAPELRDWYAASTVLVFPTYHHEGLGRIVIEAQAMGLPVVAYATAGVREGVRHGETGFLVPTGNVARLAERTRAIIEDPQLRLRLGREGRAFVHRRYSTDALASRHEDLYLAAIERRAPVKLQPAA